MKINKCKHDSIMLYWQDIEDRTLPHTCYVECAECGLSDDFTFQTSAEAHEHWNTAHPDIDELKAEIAELQSKLDFMNKQPLMIVKPPDAVIYENALDANRQLKAVNKRIEAKLETYKKALELCNHSRNMSEMKNTKTPFPNCYVVDYWLAKAKEGK